MASERITAFVDWFIGRYETRANINDLYLSDPDRADRMEAAAENGADGSTHREIINDWREAFAIYIRDRRRNRPERFIAAVEAHFDSVEDWHTEHGSIDTEVG